MIRLHCFVARLVASCSALSGPCRSAARAAASNDGPRRAATLASAGQHRRGCACPHQGQHIAHVHVSPTPCAMVHTAMLGTYLPTRPACCQCQVGTWHHVPARGWARAHMHTSTHSQVLSRTGRSSSPMESITESRAAHMSGRVPPAAPAHTLARACQKGATHTHTHDIVLLHDEDQSTSSAGLRELWSRATFNAPTLSRHPCHAPFDELRLL